MSIFGATTSKMVQLGQRNNDALAVLETPESASHGGYPMTTPQSTPARNLPQLCLCGCGQPTNLAAKTDRRAGWVKGEPLRYIVGHRFRRNTADYLVGDNGCWVWQRGLDHKGYGRITRDGKTILVHVRNYEQRFGPVPAGLELDHKCRNRACCNPDHLEPVTHQENCRRGAQTKLNPDQVRAIRADFAAGGVSKLALARRYAISPRMIGQVIARTVWGDV